MDLLIKIFIILTIFTWVSLAERNMCCQDNLPIQNYTCANGERTWAKECSINKGYVVLASKFYLSDGDTITFNNSQAVVPRDRYCLGTLETIEEEVALVCFPDTSVVRIEYLFSITICCIISIVCLALTIIVYISLPKLRDLQGKCIMYTVFNLMISFICLTFLHRPKLNNSPVMCIFVASSVYFWFLCSFFWMNVVAFNIWRTTVNPRILRNNKNIFLLYNIYGWGGPLICLIISLLCRHVPGNHLKPTWAENSCWFSDLYSGIVFFYSPVLIIISSNIVMFISTGWTLWKQGKEVSNNGNNTTFRSRKFKCILYFKLFLIMGICWIFEPMSFILNSKHSFYIWWMTDFINALQGLIIFLVLVVFRKRVLRGLAQRGGVLCRKLPREWATMQYEEFDESMDEEAQKEPTANEQIEPLNRL